MWLLKIQSFVRLLNNGNWPITNMKSQDWAAYRYGKDWLEELKQVFEKHIDYVVDELHEKTKIRVMKPQGTYLLWLDFSAYPYSDDELHAKIHDQAKLILNRGTDFGKEGNLHARLNVAAPFTLIEEITKRLVETFHK